MLPDLRRKKFNNGRALLRLAFVLLVAGCSSAPPSIPLGTFVSTVSGTEAIDGRWEIVIGPAGHYELALDGQAAVTGRYAADAARVTFTDESGPMRCAAGVTSGTYAWRLEETQLVLTAIADDCRGRRGILNIQPHALKRPIATSAK